ncbi:hypothetical protein C8F01DRAFT_1084403 [Mycena amicta]|nr:hypothetical protein C8F01DRAFT_1084403 [Mycena amicta]
MIYSSRAIVPPNGFVPHGGRRVAQAAPSPPSASSPNPARRRSSVVELLADIVPGLRTAKAEPLRRHRAYQGSPDTDDSPSYHSSSIVERLSSLIAPKAKAEPLRQQAAQQGLYTYY